MYNVYKSFYKGKVIAKIETFKYVQALIMAWLI